MSQTDVDVVIVGYGPVGAFTALLLADAGLRVSILERSTEPVILPRAVGLDGESVRAFQRIGLGDEVEAILQPPRDVDEVCFTNSKRERLFGQSQTGLGPNGWRQIAFFDQPELEALLRELVGRDERIRVHLGSEVCSLSQDANRVSVHAVGPDGSESVHRGAYAIGCDGASSFVRSAVGIEWTSLGYDQDWLVIDILQGPDADLPLVTMQVCDPERLTTYVCVKDPNRRWEFQLRPGETREEMLEPERIQTLLDPWVGREHYEIRRAAVYQFHAATADRWREGRVFLAGDAAHQTPPFLGQGLNAGFRDAVNLGWKIPLVLAGTCDSAFLDSYAAERDAHARDLVEGAVGIGQLMETIAAREAGLPDPYPVSPGAGGPRAGEIPPLRDGALLTDQIGTGTRTGELLRQPRVCVAGGAEQWFDDLLGKQWSVIGRSEADLAMGPEAAKVLERLGGRSVSLDDVAVAAGEADRLFESHPAAVVRPDRAVFGVVDDTWSLDRILLEVGRKVSLR